MIQVDKKWARKVERAGLRVHVDCIHLKLSDVMLSCAGTNDNIQFL